MALCDRKSAPPSRDSRAIRRRVNYSPLSALIGSTAGRARQNTRPERAQRKWPLVHSSISCADCSFGLDSSPMAEHASHHQVAVCCSKFERQILVPTTTRYAWPITPEISALRELYNEWPPFGHSDSKRLLSSGKARMSTRVNSSRRAEPSRVVFLPDLELKNEVSISLLGLRPACMRPRTINSNDPLAAAAAGEHIKVVLQAAAAGRRSGDLRAEQVKCKLLLYKTRSDSSAAQRADWKTSTTTSTNLNGAGAGFGPLGAAQTSATLPARADSGQSRASLSLSPEMAELDGCKASVRVAPFSLYGRRRNSFLKKGAANVNRVRSAANRSDSGPIRAAERLKRKSPKRDQMLSLN